MFLFFRQNPLEDQIVEHFLSIMHVFLVLKYYCMVPFYLIISRTYINFKTTEKCCSVLGLTAGGSGNGPCEILLRLLGDFLFILQLEVEMELR